MRSVSNTIDVPKANLLHERALDGITDAGDSPCTEHDGDEANQRAMMVMLREAAKIFAAGAIRAARAEKTCPLPLPSPAGGGQ